MGKIVGLRTEILVTLSFLLVAALLLGGLLMLRLTEQRLLAERLDHLDQLVRIVSAAVVPHISNFSEPEDKGIALILSGLIDGGDCDAWWFYDRQLELQASYSASNRSPFSIAVRQQVRTSGDMERRVIFPSLLELFHHEAAGVQIAVPLVSQGRFGGLLELHFSLDDIRLQLIDALKLLLIYVVLYGLVLIAAGYYLLQRNIIRPAKLLHQATQAVAAGRLDTHLPVGGPIEIAGLAVAYNDMITALKNSRAETGAHIEALQQSNRELQQVRDELVRSEKMASVGHLAAGLAHELGNPLTALIGYLEVLKGKLAPLHERNIVERSITETRRIDYLVRELLNFSRPADKIPCEPIDPLVELQFCRDLLADQGVLGSVTVVDNLPRKTVAVMISREKIRQVFVNLLLNAVHACDDKGVIDLAAEVNESQVLIAVGDNGCGIDPARLTHIFDPFYTTKAPGRGTGLGLSICHRIVDEAGGRLLVSSEPGQGSTFRVELPRVK